MVWMEKFSLCENLRSWSAKSDHEEGVLWRCVEAAALASVHLVAGFGPSLVRLIVTCRNVKKIWGVKSVKHKSYRGKMLILF